MLGMYCESILNINALASSGLYNNKMPSYNWTTTKYDMLQPIFRPSNMEDTKTTVHVTQ